MPVVVRTLRFFVASCLLSAGSLPVARAVEPGVDIAAPRVALSTASGFSFSPAILRVEQGDHVRWRVGSGIHTTTSGSPCVANGLWSSALDSVTTMFTRQFLEPPGTLPYFCMPHCGLGMTGQVVVTTPIDLTVTDAAGATQLDWTGGGTLFRVFRSPAPPFTTGTVVLTTAGGTTQRTFLDQTGATPSAGTAFFYLVMNQF